MCPETSENVSEKYFDNWSSREGVLEDFAGYEYVDGKRVVNHIPDFPTDEEILFAVYSYGDYSGSAMVLFRAGDRLFEVSGGHCSCYGIEGDWSPGEVTWDALALRPLDTYAYDYYPSEAVDRLKALIAENATSGVKA